MATVRQQRDEENARALRLAAALLWQDTAKDGGSSLSVSVSLRRAPNGSSKYTVRMGEAKGAAPSLGGALLAALDQVGVN